MRDRVFFDTNVFVYAFDQDETIKSEIARALIHEYGTNGRLIISTQVLQEFYVAVTRGEHSKLAKEEAEAIVNDLAEFQTVLTDKEIIFLAMQRHQNSRFSFWDSLIIEAALDADCRVLFSEDMQHGYKADKLKIINPFKALV